MNAPLRVPTRTRTPLMTRSFHDAPPSRGDEPHLPNLALPFPPRPVLLVQPHEAPPSPERLVSRLPPEHAVAADHPLGLAEGPVGHGQLPSGHPNARPRR